MSNLRVELREENQTPSVIGDSSQLLHVFLQIISNAMDALQEVGGGELLISINPCEPQVCIQFADSGPGIQHPQRVFEPFFTTKPVGQGTGLGLSTCYGIIRQHNGDISCGNRLEGGAFFTLFLPSSTAPLTAQPEGIRWRWRKRNEAAAPAEFSDFRGLRHFRSASGGCGHLQTFVWLDHFGDSIPCALLIVAILAVRENFQVQRGVLPIFWKLLAAGMFQMLLSEVYWFYYDTVHRYSTPSPVIGDTLFLLAHVFFLSAFVVRPYSSTAGRDMRLRHLDFALLTLWWLTLYAYFALPWQAVIQDFTRYNPAFYLLALIQHLIIIAGLLVGWKRSAGLWRGILCDVHSYFCFDRRGKPAAERRHRPGPILRQQFFRHAILFLARAAHGCRFIWSFAAAH